MKKRNLIYILIFSSIQIAFGQIAFQNSGNLHIHDQGQIGFHTNLVNNGSFSQMNGFTGFYNSEESIEVSGANKVNLFNVEVDVEDDLYLSTSLIVQNNLNFIRGKIITPRDDLSVKLEFLNYFVYAGENDNTYVDGYVKTTNNGEFVFPIGDANSLRTMMLPNQLQNTTFNGAYFYEDPNDPSTFDTSFETSKKLGLLHKISEVEFWDLNGNEETEVVLTWNFHSNLSALTDDIKRIRVVGWDKRTNNWIDLGGNNLTGDLNEGSVQSIKFVPDNYEIITIGSDFTLVGGIETTSYSNYVITPNGDGFNDYLEIEGIELRPNNTIKILNRWGALVFSKKGYKNTWNGNSEHKATINRSKGLPGGTYYYILNFYDENITHTGYIYLGR